MNYYERHLGDYARDTGHLSMLEHGAYTLLLDRYYITEQGIPASQAQRIARARTKEERDAVDSVLAEFFTLIDGVWINPRAEAEIADARVRIDAARSNGKSGGRPKKHKPSDNPTTNQTITQQKPSGLSLGSEMETQQKALQAPGSRHQSPEPEQSLARVSTSPQGETMLRAPPAAVMEKLAKAGEMAIALRRLNVDATSSNPTLLSWIDAGITPTQMVEFAEIARSRKGDQQRISVGYLDAMRRGQMAERITPLVANGSGAPRKTRFEQAMEAIGDE